MAEICTKKGEGEGEGEGIEGVMQRGVQSNSHNSDRRRHKLQYISATYKDLNLLQYPVTQSRPSQVGTHT